MLEKRPPTESDSSLAAASSGCDVMARPFSGHEVGDSRAKVRGALPHPKPVGRKNGQKRREEPHLCGKPRRSSRRDTPEAEASEHHPAPPHPCCSRILQTTWPISSHAEKSWAPASVSIETPSSVTSCHFTSLMHDRSRTCNNSSSYCIRCN